MKKSFTLLEVIFVIVLIAIISSVAIPNFVNTIDKTYIVKFRGDIAMIRSEIKQFRNDQLLLATTGEYPSTLESILQNLNITDSWQINDNIYNLIIKNQDNTEFIYDNSTGKFDCLHKTQELCEDLTR
jgi:general secretion pathway protein G